jgi:hypothetical protein
MLEEDRPNVHINGSSNSVVGSSSSGVGSSSSGVGNSSSSLHAVPCLDSPSLQSNFSNL